MNITRAKGTHDILTMRVWNYILENIKAHLTSYNFQEVATPIIEPAALFVRSLGTHTDVISKQMFMVQAQSEEQLCLRPEATASVVRAFGQAGSSVTTPWRVFLIGPMFRYERPQKGRYRQFHQVSIELIGAPSYHFDVELIVLLDRMFKERLRCSSYALQLNSIGCTQDRSRFIQVLTAFLQEHAGSICSTCTKRLHTNPLRIFDCKEQECQTLYKQAPHTLDYLCSSCAADFTALTQSLELLAVSFQINHALVRGLDYYQKTVFEFVGAALGAQNAFCGGGRYDQLLSEISGAQDQPSIGAAIGLERLQLLLEAENALPADVSPYPLYAIIPMTESQQMVAFLLADSIRTDTRPVEVVVSHGSLKSMMRNAGRLGAAVVCIIGPDEQQANTVVVKDMKQGTQQVVSYQQLNEYITQLDSAYRP